MACTNIHNCFPAARLPWRQNCQITLYKTLFIAPGGARLVTHQRGHPGGLGQDGVVPRRHVSQRRAAGPAEGPAEGVDVEPDPGDRAAPLPEPPQRPGHPATTAGEGDQGLHIAGPGCRPAPQGLLLIIVVVIAISWADQQPDEVTRLHRKRPSGSLLHLELFKLDSALCRNLTLHEILYHIKNTSVWLVLWDVMFSWNLPNTGIGAESPEIMLDYFNETRTKDVRGLLTQNLLYNRIV